MKRYWYGFLLVVVISFAVLIWIGTRIYHQAPPVPVKVVTTDGTVAIGEGSIDRGQNVWQALGGMESGSIWGHGSYVAPDWSADYLHRECVFILDRWAMNEKGKKYDDLPAEDRGSLQKRLEVMMKTNNYNPATGILTIEPERFEAFKDNLKHYSDIYINGKDDYAIHKNAQPDTSKLRDLAAWFFWSSWAASANRPGDNISYTSNWPHEKLINNVPTGDTVVWTGVSIIMLLTGIGAMSLYYIIGKKGKEDEVEISKIDPLLGGVATPSQKAVIKYFFVVTGLILVQIIMGIVTAHYGVEGNGFYGFPLSTILPYSVARTWHVQLAIFWIATAWLAAGLYIGPAVSRTEPKGQRLGVNVLFVALLVVVLGSMAGQWMSIMNKFTGNNWFLFGHQGYEYLDLGRIWQITLLVGLFLWLFLVARTVVPAIKSADINRKPLITLFLISTIAIVVFYIPGLFYGQNSSLSVIEYWRWWVVHLWVEGFFEVFATVVIAFLFANLGLIKPAHAAKAALLSSTIFLSGGIIVTLHHLYFSGTPTIALAFGSVFSALEVVPLVFVGYEAWDNYKISKNDGWLRNYKWPIYYFIAVSFWNLVGAGLFGFMINPPIALYYMQGLNTTPVHAHAALFGVYGMLGIALMLFAFRSHKPEYPWKEKMISFSFWAINIGLFLMIVLSLLPIGLLQTKASVEIGYWYARSAEFLKSDGMDTLRWMRVIGDTVFALGAFALVIFVIGLVTGRSYIKKEGKVIDANSHGL
jgi:nitric oxide reductase subunit B